MKNIFCTIVVFFVAICFAYSQEVYQINELGSHYLISVTHGGNPLGDIEIEMFPDLAPKHCQNFDSLVAIKFYDGTAFHRVIPNFMIQGGDPNSKNYPNDKTKWGYGDPSQTKVPAEFSSKSHIRGILSAARANDPNSATSQFFICIVAYPSLNGLYSVYGQVVKGMDVADKIVNVPRDAKDNPLQKVEMKIVKLAPNAVNEFAIDNNIQIYPNPSTNYIHFKSEFSNINISEFQISDINGNIYLKKSINNLNINDLTIPISNLSIGVYLLKFIDSNSLIHNMRFVVQ